MRKAFAILLVVAAFTISCRGKRTGAICEDGWESSATGSGACSHHGGVDHWLYE